MKQVEGVKVHEKKSTNLEVPRGEETQMTATERETYRRELEESKPEHTVTDDTPTKVKELPLHKPWRGTWALSSAQMHHAYESGIIPEPPQITAEELSDRSKGDALIKAIAIAQITWLVIQIIARSFQSLAITLLEITVLAFAATAIGTYALLWRKPQDVMVPVYVDASEILARKQIIRLAARAPISSMIVHSFWLHGVAVRVMADNIFPNTKG